MALVAFQGLTFAYPAAERPALDAVDLAVEPGQFVVLCGRSGCGKTTLLRHLKTALTPHGSRTGEVLFDGCPLHSVGHREQAQRIGFVLQNPDNQLVTDKVWHELAFGLESLGMPQLAIRLRVAEMASFFGIQEWYHKGVAELSGGQKQLLNLAAVMAMQPDLLILDEPTSQLDPIAAAEFIGALRRVNGELGTTIVLSEHRLDEAVPVADRVVVMNGGRIVADGSPPEVGRLLAASADPMLTAMPTPTRVCLAVEDEAGACPVSVREGRVWLRGRLDATRTARRDEDRALTDDPGDAKQVEAALSVAGGAPDGAGAPAARLRGAGAEPPVITLKEVWFRYEKQGADILRGTSFTVHAGELFCIVGGNGTGKTTALGVLSGQLRAYRGKVRTLGLDPGKCNATELFSRGLVALPQDPQTLFLRNTIAEDLWDAAAFAAADHDERERLVLRAAGQAEIEDILDRHPYDVSGGEQQRAGLAKALLAEPRLLLLDEPTKGMDGFFKQKLADILSRLRDDGLTVVMVSHDIEFCAAHASRCALFFDGGVVTEGEPAEFFAGNSFYTTAASRMSRGLLEGVVKAEDIVAALAVIDCDRDYDRDSVEVAF